MQIPCPSRILLARRKAFQNEGPLNGKWETAEVAVPPECPAAECTIDCSEGAVFQGAPSTHTYVRLMPPLALSFGICARKHASGVTPSLAST